MKGMSIALLTKDELEKLLQFILKDKYDSSLIDEINIGTVILDTLIVSDIKFDEDGNVAYQINFPKFDIDFDSFMIGNQMFRSKFDVDGIGEKEYPNVIIRKDES